METNVGRPMKQINRFFVIILFCSFLLDAQDGSFDASFDSDGIVITDIGTDKDNLTDILIQQDGKIVAVGSTNIPGPFSQSEICIVRYNPDGTLDTSFDTDGKVITQLSSGGNEEGNAVAIQSDGKIVVVGQSPGTIYDEIIILRFNTNGSLDSTFGNNGLVIADINSKDDVSFDVLIQPDGKIVITASTRFGTTESFLLRYNIDGSLDNTFGNTGVGWIQDALARKMAIHSDGKIVVACPYLIGSTGVFYTVRFDTSGNYDNSYGTTGKIITDITSGVDQATCISIQGDGKIIAAGSSSDGTNHSFSLVRYNSDGSIDETFSDDGIVITPIGSSNAIINSIDIQSDGKIVATGYAAMNGNTINIAIVRYNSNGSLDNTFGSNGILTPSIGTSSSQGQSVLIQQNGKILVGGSASKSNQDFMLARFNSSVDLLIDINAYLEGPYNFGAMNTLLIQIPISQPYGSLPWDYSGTESVTSIPADVVDWVLVELRTSTEASSTVKRIAAFIDKYGKIVDLDGVSPLKIKYFSGNYYVVIYHRNHIPIMSSGLVYLSP